MRARLILSSLLMALPTAAQAAPCEVYKFPFSLADDNIAIMAVHSGKDCAVRIRPTGTLELDSAEIVTRPSHGGARAHGTSGAYYRSNPGYKGRDTFSFTLCGTENGKPGCTEVRVRVFVR